MRALCPGLGEGRRGDLVVPLGAARVPDEDLIGDLDRLAGAGLPVAEGFVLTGEARREFVREVFGAVPVEAFGTRRERSSLGERLDAPVREALISLKAASVVVRCGGASRHGLGTIPAVLSAVRRLWLRTAGGDDEGRSWPALVQRELRSELTVRASRAEIEAARLSAGLSDEERDLMSRLILEAEYVLGGPLRVEWSLEKGRWYIASVDKDLRRRPGA